MVQSAPFNLTKPPFSVAIHLLSSLSRIIFSALLSGRPELVFWYNTHSLLSFIVESCPQTSIVITLNITKVEINIKDNLLIINTLKRENNFFIYNNLLIDCNLRKLINYMKKFT